MAARSIRNNLFYHSGRDITIFLKFKTDILQALCFSEYYFDGLVGVITLGEDMTAIPANIPYYIFAQGLII